MSDITHQPCQYDRYCSIYAKIGGQPPVLYSVVHPGRDDRERLAINHAYPDDAQMKILQPLNDISLDLLINSANSSDAEKSMASELIEARAAIKNVEEDAAAEAHTRRYMRRILTSVAEILKGKPPENMMHGWHDLPEQLTRTLNLLKRTNQMLLSAQQIQLEALHGEIATKSDIYASCMHPKMRCVCCGESFSRQDGMQ